MFGLKKLYYRSFQAVFNIGARVLHWRKAVRVEGPGSIERIPELIDGLGMQNPLLVTDKGLMEAGVAPKVLQVLQSWNVPHVLFDEVEANPSVQTVNRIWELYTRQKCDGVIAVGGGSPMDAAKIAMARVARPRKSVQQLGGLLRVGRKIPPFIAVPTTAGTGSETTIAALVTDTTTHHKYAVMDLHLIPLYAVLDPELTLALPPHITAATGMDALTHAAEAYLCWTYNTKESLCFAEEAVAAIFKNLYAVYQNGQDVNARLEMQVASYKAGFAFTRAGVGNVHAIAHTLGGLYNTPHGLANAVLLPIVLEDYGPVVYKKLARLAKLAGLATGAGDEQDAKAFIAAIRQLNASMDIPTGFTFVLEKDIPQMVQWALQECNPLYPVPVVYDEKRCRTVIEVARQSNTPQEEDSREPQGAD